MGANADECTQAAVEYFVVIPSEVSLAPLVRDDPSRERGVQRGAGAPARA